MTNQDIDLPELIQPKLVDTTMEDLEDKTLNLKNGMEPPQDETFELEGESFQHEDDETFTLRLNYQEALREAQPDLDDEVITIIAMMVVKKARYGVIYEEEVEQLINDMNDAIRQQILSEERSN